MERFENIRWAENKDQERTENSQQQEGLNFVFEQNPDLIEIGSRESYAEYLGTIFPDSRLKDIIYHGTSDLEGRTLNRKSSFKKHSDLIPDVSKIGFWFSFERETSELFAKDALKRVDPENLNRKRERLEDFKIRLQDFSDKYPNESLDDLYNQYVSWYSDEPYVVAAVVDVKNPKYFSDNAEIYNELTQSSRADRGAGGSLIYRRGDVDCLIQKKGDLNYHTEKRFTEHAGSQILIFEPEQIHVLGSDQDREQFKVFMASHT